MKILLKTSLSTLVLVASISTAHANPQTYFPDYSLWAQIAFGS